LNFKFCNLYIHSPTRPSIRDQNIGHFLQYIASSGPDGAGAVLRFIDTHWANLSERYPPRSIVKRIVGQIADPDNVAVRGGMPKKMASDFHFVFCFLFFCFVC
jgi:hypothetical protein